MKNWHAFQIGQFICGMDWLFNLYHVTSILDLDCLVSDQKLIIGHRGSLVPYE